MDSSSRIAFSVDEFARAAGIGRTMVYAEIRAGRLVPVKVGKRTLVPADEASGLIGWRTLMRPHDEHPSALGSTAGSRLHYAGDNAVTPRSTAANVAGALRSTRTGEGRWQACCPSHNDKNPSLSIRDANGKVLVRCHAGCDQRDVIAALKSRGLWDGKMRPRPRRASRQKATEAEHDPQQPNRSAAAFAIWQSTVPAAGTLVEAYLATRGLTLRLPPPVRFHHGLKHPSGSVWPCMVALVTRGVDGMPTACHRTFLARDGSGKAPVDPVKMMLGPCRGGAVRLGEPGEVLMVGGKASRVPLLPCWRQASPHGLRFPLRDCERSTCPARCAR